MKIAQGPLDCYIGCFRRPLAEPYLRDNGFSQGMIQFAIPSHGVLFRCRADGSYLDLEFGALFALLRFIHTSLAGKKIKAVRVHSSHPELVFAVAHNSRQIRDDQQRLKLMQKYRALFDLQVCYVPPQKNQTRLSPGQFPCTPRGQEPPVKPKSQTSRPPNFRSIQKGLNL